MAAEQARRRQQLGLAAEVHRSLLPSPVRHERIHLDVRYIPIEEVGGDYGQVQFPYGDACHVAIWDVTGHGIGPALLATRVSSEVRHSLLYDRAPHDIVQGLNAFVCEHFSQTELYLSFVAARIDLAQRRIAWSGAGHPSPLLVRRDGEVRYLESESPLIGVYREGFGDQPNQSLPLEPGDRLVFYTDGLTDTAHGDGRMLGTAGLAEIAAEAMSADLFDMADPDPGSREPAPARAPHRRQDLDRGRNQVAGPRPFPRGKHSEETSEVCHSAAPSTDVRNTPP